MSIMKIRTLKLKLDSLFLNKNIC